MAMSTTDPALELVTVHLDTLLHQRQYPKTLCPSEAARALSTAELRESGVDSWRDLMPALRQLAFQMRDQGKIEILQKGNVLPLDQTIERTTGPIRLRQPSAP